MEAKYFSTNEMWEQLSPQTFIKKITLMCVLIQKENNIKGRSEGKTEQIIVWVKACHFGYTVSVLQKDKIRGDGCRDGFII